MTIPGTNFTTASAAKFGTTACTATFHVVSSTSITCKTPVHAAGTVTVKVTGLDGTATLANAYTFVTRPTVTGVSPVKGSAVGGTPVTITGTNFTTASAVTFGGTACTTTFHVVSATSITCKTPVHAAGR